jgi:hypothetical protein
MSDDRREIALQALRAAGHDDAAALVAAIIPGASVDPVPAPAPAAVAPPAADPAELTSADLNALSQMEVLKLMSTPEGEARLNAALRAGV